MDQQKISYRQISGNHTVQRLQHYCKETGAVLLAMTHGHYDLVSRLFGHSETREAVSHQHIAVMIIPYNLK